MHKHYECKSKCWFAKTFDIVRFFRYNSKILDIMYATLWKQTKRGRRKMPFHIHAQNHIHYNLYFPNPFSFFFKAWWHKIWYFVKHKNSWWQPFYLGSVLPIILHYTFSLYMTFKATYNTHVKLLSHLHVLQ